MAEHHAEPVTPAVTPTSGTTPSPEAGYVGVFGDSRGISSPPTVESHGQENKKNGITWTLHSPHNGASVGRDNGI